MMYQHMIYMICLFADATMRVTIVLFWCFLTESWPTELSHDGDDNLPIMASVEREKNEITRSIVCIFVANFGIS